MSPPAFKTLVWYQVLIVSIFLEFNGRRENAVSTNERLQQEAQAVLDVIENPDVAQALRQDKNQNLQYLKENYNVRPPPPLRLLLPPKRETDE